MLTLDFVANYRYYTDYYTDALLDPENVGVAVGISSQSSIGAEIAIFTSTSG